MKNYYSIRIFALLMLCLLLNACASRSAGPSGNTNGSGGASYKVGQPYQIGGEWYYPKEDYSYDETGVASWYGGDFHDQRTANGEIFNKNELTAAHKTLPLPTLARVTNLDNGRSIVVRINDRGPFSSGRIIDMSQRAAQLLGFEGQGTAKVRVQVLADESKAIADAMRHYGGKSAVAEASAAPQTPVQSEVLEPVQTNPEIHRQLLQTQPVAEVVQLPVTGRNQLYIQAGAFSVSANADRLKQSLSKFGSTSVTTALVNGTTFYRVRVGPVANVAKADELLSQVKKAGAPGARTIVD